jgi:CheY-like chemotaxis protein
LSEQSGSNGIFEYTFLFLVEITSRPNLPIIALTAYAIPEVHYRALEMGCNDFIPKPANRDFLLQKVFEYIRMAKTYSKPS